MKLLNLMFLAAAGAAAVANADTFNIQHVNYTTAVVPPAGGPQCLPKRTISLANKNAAIIVGDGTNAESFIATNQYFADRGVAITVVCADSSDNVLNVFTQTRAVLMRGFYPLYSVKCDTTTDALGWDMEDYDVVVIPDGYTATLPMRRSSNMQSKLVRFTQPTTTTTSDFSLLMLGGASELLIDAGIIKGLNCSVQVPMSTTPSVSTAVATHCHGVHNSAAPRHHLQFASGTRNIIIGANHDDLPAMLAHWEARVLNTTTAITLCNNTQTTEIIDYPAAAVTANCATITEANWDTLLAATDASAAIVGENSSSTVTAMCTNAEGVDFCLNAPVSLVVAHGSHHRSVRSLAHVFSAMSTVNHVFCPDADEEHSFGEGYVYLSSEPSYVPTHRILCTAYYNRTDILTSTLVIIPGGDIATHHTLRNNYNLIKALQYTGTFSAFGTGLSLLNAIEVVATTSGKGKSSEEEGEGGATDVTAAPYFPATNTDMDLLGLNATAATQAVMLFRNSHERRTKVLGAYRAPSAFSDAMLAFTEQSVAALVWENAPSGMADMALLIGVFGAAGIIAVGLLAVLCVRARGPTTRTAGASRSRTESTITEPLSMKFHGN